MTRFCDICRLYRPLCDFDLDGGDVDGGDVLEGTCRDCAGRKGAGDELRARRVRRAQIAALERRRRRMIAALVRIDAEIAELRAGPLVPRMAMMFD